MAIKNLVFCTAPDVDIQRATDALKIQGDSCHYTGAAHSHHKGIPDVRFHSWGKGSLNWIHFALHYPHLRGLNPQRVVLPLNNSDGTGYGYLRLMCRMISSNSWEVPKGGEPRRITWGRALSDLETAWHSMVLRLLDQASPLLHLWLKPHVQAAEPGPRTSMQSETLQDLYEETPPEASIIIRTYNEERYLADTLEMIRRQKGPEREVIVIDSESTDRTVDIARSYPIRVYRIPKSSFHYSATLNLGARLARGRYLVFLSAHSVPQDELWLANLLAPMQSNSNVAGVVGREVPLPNWASPFERKLLADIFRDEPRVMTDSFFFSNANAAVQRERVLSTPFDESIHWGEDQVWADAMHRQGYETVYRPESVVAHSHNLSMTACFTRTLRFQRTLFSRMHRDSAEETRDRFRAGLPLRASAFRRYLASHRLVASALAWFYAPWCEWMNFQGCEWAYREWKTNKRIETVPACGSQPGEVLP